MDADSRKRSHDEASESSSDDDLGPALPNASVRPKKKKRKLPYESLYLAALPKSPRYFRSLMHRDQLSFATLTPHTDFLITTSIDGVVKFWKKGKEGEGVDFVKEFRAHTAGAGEGDQSSQGVGVRSIACSADGRSFASSGPGGGTATGHMVSGEGSDGQSPTGSVCIWDVVNFDLITMLQIGRPAATLCWVHGKGASQSLLALAEEGSNIIKIYDGSGNNKEPVFSFNDIHRSPVVAMAYNSTYDCVVSADDKGMVEYWTPNAMHEKPSNVFEYKSSTNLFDFKRSKSVPTGITISPSGAQFATFSLPDRQVRVFDFASAKLYRSYDESIATLTAMQQAGTALAKLDELDFGRRLATEHALAASPAVAARITIIFDESSNFILYGSLLGVKVINTLTNRCVRVYGKDEPFRALSLALYQGQPAKKGVVTAQMAASTNPLLEEAETSDPMLVTTAMAKVRFYVFTNDNTAEKSSRDIQNEKPRNIGKAGSSAAIKQAESGTSAVLHTTLGEIHVRLFPDVAPKAVENFVTHARRGYYNGTIFHRVIKKFMIQGGDPLGDGTGGESIWGKNFEDEFSSLKHDKPYTLSMANAGPNTNGSQFFVTTVKTPWLDDKHTIFGRAVQGLDVVHRIENARTGRKNEKPEEDIKIVNIEVT